MKIACLIVLYNSALNELRKQIDSLDNSIDFYLIDNSTQQAIITGNNDCFLQWKREGISNVFLFQLFDNKGIAFAQNFGIQKIGERPYQAVLFLDDDSVLNKGFLGAIITDYKKAETRFKHFAVVPRVKTASGEEIGFYKKHLNNSFETNMLMNSGALIPVKTLQYIGVMDENLFIDYVDYDFGWRLLKQGGEIIVSEKAFITHTLGEKEIYFLGKRIFVSTGTRLYYQTRNIFLLLNKDYAPKSFLVKNIIKNSVKSVIQAMAQKNKLYITMFVKGMVDGIKQYRTVRRK